MIHQFKKGDWHFVVDVNSGAIHIVDTLAAKLVALYQDNNLDQVIERLAGEFSRNDIEYAYREVQTLVDGNMLFTQNNIIETERFLHRKPVVKALCLHVAHDCNIRCKYCFAAQGNFEGERLLMPLAVGKKALQFLVENSGQRRQLEVDLFGGEPLMNWDVCRALVDYGRVLEKQYNKIIRFTITTNGILLDDVKIDYINEHFHNVVLSIDGRPEVNDLMRPTVSGMGTYDLIVPKFKKLIEGRNGKSYYVRGTFTSQNTDFDKDVLHLANLGFKETSVEPVVSDPKDFYSLSEGDLPAIFAAYDRLADAMVKRLGSEKAFRFFHFTIDLARGPCLIKRVSGCGAGTEYLAITPEGDIYPCHQFVGDQQFLMGNVMTEQFHTLDQHDFKEAHVESKLDCQVCWAKYYCSGGCHANAYNFNGTIEQPYELGCKMERKRIENAIYLQANKQLGGSDDR